MRLFLATALLFALHFSEAGFASSNGGKEDNELKLEARHWEKVTLSEDARLKITRKALNILWARDEEDLAAQGVDVNFWQDFHEVREREVRKLVREGANPELLTLRNAEAESTTNMVIAAARDGSTTGLVLLKWFIELGANLRLFGSNNNSALHAAVTTAAAREHSVRLGAVKALLDAGVPVDLVPEKPNPKIGDGTALFWAVSEEGGWHNHTGVTDYLIDHKANVNYADSNGLTPLHIAATRNDMPLTRALLDAGANIEAKTKKDVVSGAYTWFGSLRGVHNYPHGATPLMCAMYIEFPDLADPTAALLLYQRGANPDVKDTLGRSVADHARLGGNALMASIATAKGKYVAPKLPPEGNYGVAMAGFRKAIISGDVEHALWFREQLGENPHMSWIDVPFQRSLNVLAWTQVGFDLQPGVREKTGEWQFEKYDLILELTGQPERRTELMAGKARVRKTCVRGCS